MLIIKNNNVKKICSEDIDSMVNSSAFKNGIGVFETIKIITQNNVALGEYLDEHYNRLNRAAQKIGLKTDLDFKTLKNSVDALLKELNVENGAIRISLCADIYPETFCLIEWQNRFYTKEQKEEGYNLTISDYKINPYALTSGIKCLSNAENIVAFHIAKAKGFNEAVRLNADGFIAECCISNIFWIKANTLYTPSLKSGCLDGIMRAHIIEDYKKTGFNIEEGLFRLDSLYAADKVFISNALMGQMKVNSIERKDNI